MLRQAQHERGLSGSLLSRVCRFALVPRSRVLLPFFLERDATAPASNAALPFALSLSKGRLVAHPL
jgi:hypothetical protein